VQSTEFLEPIVEDMRAIDAVIRLRLRSDVPLISSVAEYIIGAGGKRLRPALLVLTARCLGHRDMQPVHELAAVVEFIHTATLLHDDVVDESALRRGRATANAMFGNAASVLVGDFLYSRAFQMMVGVGQVDVLRILADATNVIAEGEVLQLMNMHEPGVDIERYLRVIRFKTAKLFEAAARLGAVMAGASVGQQEQAAVFGQSLGTAFQLIDDMLDFSGDAEQMGKNIGDDLREGKPTLPLIVAMQRASAEDRAIIEAAIREGGIQDIGKIGNTLEATGALEATHDCAAREARRGLEAIAEWPDNPYRRSLVRCIEFSVERKH
jgi:octaprenyl-diphosphate synthase